MLPKYAAVVATSALAFQVAVLYPWHSAISKDLVQLRQVVERVDALVERVELRDAAAAAAAGRGRTR